jgi:hypothetical protein
MKQEAYRTAFNEANSELNEILGLVEKLRARKEQVEVVVEALKPLVNSQAQAFAA